MAHSDYDLNDNHRKIKQMSFLVIRMKKKIIYRCS